MAENAKSKTAIVADLLRKGTTTAEVLKVTGWPSVSMPAMAKAAGLELTKHDENGITIYKGVPLTQEKDKDGKQLPKPVPAPLEEFRKRVLEHASIVAKRASKIDNEAKTNISLVQPFLAMLGYNVADTDEVSPEHHADFSDKYQNKVDYAILLEGKPVIALESKRAGAPLKDDRGQLKSYFNACRTVKLGILTDGLNYELYAEDEPNSNYMDETAFLRLNFPEIDKNGTIDDNTLDGLAELRKGFFNPDDVGPRAKRRRLFAFTVELMKQYKSEPSNEFVRFVLECSPIKIKKLTQPVVDEYREVIRSAIEEFVAQGALARLGYAPKDVIRTPPVEATTIGPAAVAPEPQLEEISPSVGEMNAFNYVKNRLCFLVRNEVLFQEVQKVDYRKYRASFGIFYAKPNNGSLFDYKEHKDGKVCVQFPALNSKEIEYVPSAELDDCLLNAFRNRVTEAGISLTPVLRTIQGGQSNDVA
jgi:hypothetical protein